MSKDKQKGKKEKEVEMKDLQFMELFSAMPPKEQEIFKGLMVEDQKNKDARAKLDEKFNTYLTAALKTLERDKDRKVIPDEVEEGFSLVFTDVSDPIYKIKGRDAETFSALQRQVFEGEG